MGERVDAETVRELMFRYFHEMRDAIERHGGTVEKFIGDAVMAVFGVPDAHEDDALRACRAAHEMQQRIAELAPELEGRFGTRLQARIGVNTGEVVAGAGRETFATGDAVNVAARLEQAAAPGEVVIGELTYRLAGEAVEAEPLAPVEARGKVEPLSIFRLRHVAATSAPRPAAAPLVGREREIHELEAAFERACAEGRCLLVTVVGEPGVGKSRLVADGEMRLGSRGRVLNGRCLSYGEGITFWPVAEIVRAAAAIHDDDSAEEARAKVGRLVDDQAASRIGALIGLGGSVAPEDVAWALRHLVAALAAERPLVLAVEDLHWAEPTLLDLLAGLVGLEAPVLLLATARPDLLEARPEWPGVVRLQPLAASETERLLQELGAEPNAELVARAGGNPLFVHELAALLREDGDAASVPSSLSGLLAARLDRLPASERDALERAAVEGETFHRGAVAALLDTEVGVAAARLSALVERELAFPAQARFVDEAAFRFRHVLVRDAAYGALVKRLRAELHERFADWLEGKVGDRLAEVEEIVGYHLEQAYRYSAELGQRGAGERELAARAAGYLGRAGLRAFGRSDMPATVGLLRRASALLPSGAPERLRLLPELAIALGETGRFDEAKSVLEEAVEEARHAGDRAAEGRARIEQLFLRVDDPEGVTKAEAAVPALVALFEELGDDQALARVWRLYGYVVSHGFRNADAAAAMERVLQHARRAGDEREEGLALFWIPSLAVFGPIPAEEGIRRCEALLEEAAGSTSAEAGVRNGLSLLYAMVERAEEARTAMQESREQYRELGLEVLCGVAAMHEGPLGLYLGDPGAAESGLREAMEMLERLGERGYRSTAAVWLAQALNDQARYAEAEQATRLSEELASVDDMPSQVGWRSERARALARRGELDEAERLAREAVALSEPTDSLDFEGEAAFALAEVLRFARRIDEAAEAAGQALAAWERKGIVGYVERARALLAELHVAT